MGIRVRLQGGDRAFVAEPGETVLDAARRAGLALPYSCLSGRCGSCKATIVSGTCHYPHQPPQALDGQERAASEALLCQAVPLTDLVIAAREVPTVADYPRRVLALKVAEMTRLAPEVMRLMLKPARGERLRYLAGQYLDVLLSDGRRRAFSIANAPEDAERIELHVRHVTGGGFTEHVFQGMRVGDVLRVEGPLGTFVPREDSDRPMLMLAGGTGFAPIKAIVEHFLHHLGSARPIHLYRGVRDVADLYLPELPQRWVEQHPAFVYTPVLSEPGMATAGYRVGLAHEALLHDHTNLAAYDVYMSGPPAMIEAARRTLLRAGLSHERLYYDSFEYAPDVLAAILRARAGIQHE